MLKLLRKRSGPLLAVLAGIAVLALGSSAQAQFTMRLEAYNAAGALTGSATVTDGGVGDLAPGTAGQIVFSGALGSFTNNVTTGVSKPILPVSGNAFAEIDLNSINALTSGAGAIRITLADTGFTNPPGAQTLIVEQTIGGVFSGPVGSVLLANSWANAANLSPNSGAVDPSIAIPPTAADFIVPAGSAQAGLITTSAGPFSGTTSGNFAKGAGPYSLFSEVIMYFSGPGSASFNQTTRVLPAPGALALLLSGAPLAGLAYLRRRWKGETK
jgi:hypothetical protein